MAKKGRAYLKSRFETGDVPTEQDYIDFLDSYNNLTEDTEANTWYVNTNGDDANVGSPEFPFKTMQKAVDFAAQYDIIKVQDIYYSSGSVIVDKILSIVGPIPTGGGTAFPAMNGTWTIDNYLMFENIAFTADIISSATFKYLEFTNSQVSVNSTTQRNLGIICAGGLFVANTNAEWKWAILNHLEISPYNATDTVTVGQYVHLNDVYHFQEADINFVFGADSTSRMLLYNSTLRGDASGTGDLTKYNSVITGTVTVSGTTTNNAQDDTTKLSKTDTADQSMAGALEVGGLLTAPNDITTGAPDLAYGQKGYIDSENATQDVRIDNLEENQVTGVETYSTFASLPVTGTLQVSYKVTNDPNRSLNGYYSWNGSIYVVDDNPDHEAIALNTAGRQVTSALAANKDYVETYDGISAYTILSKSYNISAVGDFIEVVFKNGTNAGESNYAHFGEIGTQPNRIGFIGTTAYVWDSTNTLHFKTSFGDTETDFTRVRFEVSASGLDYIYEGVVKDTFVGFSGLVIDGIGNCNLDNFANLELVSIEIESTADGNLKESVPSANVLNESKHVSLSDYGRLILKNTSVLKTINDTGEYLTELDNLYSAYDGSTASTTLDNEYELDAEGDYIEITARGNAFPAYGLVGVKTGGADSIGFNDSNDLWLRQSDGSWVFWNSLATDFSLFQKIKVEVIAGSLWQLSLNDTIISTKSKTASLRIRSFGNAYTTKANVDIKGVTINSVSGNLSAVNLYYFDAINEGVTLEQDSSVAETSAELSNYYVSYDPTGSQDLLEKFTIYQRIGETSYYILYVVEHELDNDSIVYKDVYRMTGATLYQWVEGVFISSGLVVLGGSEHEFTYSRTGKSDFTGGIHGDELYVTINWYIDNTRLTSAELVSSFDLKECDNFRYETRSTLHETSDDGINPIPGHPLEADHDKITWFKDGKRITHNKISWQAALTDINHCYIAMNACGIDMSEYCTIKNDCGVVTLTTSSGNVLTGTHDGMTIWSETNNMGAELSAVIKPDSIAANRYQFLWDTTAYAKYYLDTSWQGIFNNTVAIGEIWDGEIEVEFKKKLS